MTNLLRVTARIVYLVLVLLYLAVVGRCYTCEAMDIAAIMHIMKIHPRYPQIQVREGISSRPRHDVRPVKGEIEEESVNKYIEFHTGERKLSVKHGP
jgi:hypothetical protein